MFSLFFFLPDLLKSIGVFINLIFVMKIYKHAERLKNSYSKYLYILP